MKRIPKSFTLGANTFNVKLVSEDEMAKQVRRDCGDDGEAYGLFVPDELAIYLRKPTRHLKRSIVLQTFWHEFFHALFWTMNHKDCRNEKVVDAAGHHVKQFFDTVQF